MKGLTAYLRHRRSLESHRAAERMAQIIAQIDPEDHWRLFSRTARHLADQQCSHVAGVCYRIAAEIYKEGDLL